jgi:hypothetical protein
MSTTAKIALGAAALYLLYRISRSSASVAPGSASGGGVGGGGGLVAPVPDASKAFQRPGRQLDVARSIQGLENETDWFLDWQGPSPDQYQHNGPGRAGTTIDPVLAAVAYALSDQKFYRQVWEPASRVPISALGYDDYQLALALLSNKMDRRGCVPSASVELQQAANADPTIRTVEAVSEDLTAVGAAIIGAFTGGVGGAVVHAATAPLFGAADAQLNASEAANPVDFSQVLSSSVMQQLHVFLGESQPGTVNGQPGVPNSSTGRIGDTGVPFIYTRPALFAWDTTVDALVLRLPWISHPLNCETVAPGVQHQWSIRDGYLATRVNARARMYRALDVIACLMFPYQVLELGNDGSGAGSYWTEPRGLYAYANKPTGLILAGSIFPPVRGEDIELGHGFYARASGATDLTAAQLRAAVASPGVVPAAVASAQATGLPSYPAAAAAVANIAAVPLPTLAAPDVVPALPSSAPIAPPVPPPDNGPIASPVFGGAFSGGF